MFFLSFILFIFSAVPTCIFNLLGLSTVDCSQKRSMVSDFLLDTSNLGSYS